MPELPVQGRFRDQYSLLSEQLQRLEDNVEGDRDQFHERLHDDMVCALLCYPSVFARSDVARFSRSNREP